MSKNTLYRVFNFQFHESPSHLPIFPLLYRALSSGVATAFDTSPYYGPSESLLGVGLSHPSIRSAFPRESYTILTKVGRVSSDCFDYSPEWVRRSVRRSLKRLRTSYLDVVYCHDVEFVTEEEVLTAIRELRRIRDEEGTIKYVGLSGYPVEVLCKLAEMVLLETGEAVDIVQSYSNYNLQNTRLLSDGVARLQAAGVDVVPNASLLSMGLLRRNGVHVGSMGDWHPAPQGLRAAVKSASLWLESQGERLEVIAIRYALENWMRDGAALGTTNKSPTGPSKLGVSVMGVSQLDELEDVLREWEEILEDHKTTQSEVDVETGFDTVSTEAERTGLSVLERQRRLDTLVKGARDMIGSQWLDYAWSSPGDFKNKPHVISDEEDNEWDMPDVQPAEEVSQVRLLDSRHEENVQQQLDIKDAVRAIQRSVTPSSSSQRTTNP